MKVIFMNNSGFSKITVELNFVYYISNYYPYSVWDLSEMDNRKGTFVNIEEAISIKSYSEFEAKLGEECKYEQIVVVTNMVQSAYYKVYPILKQFNIPVIDTQKNNFMKYLEQKTALDFRIKMPFRLRLKRFLNNIERIRAINKKIKYNGVKFDYLLSAYNFAPEEVIHFTKTHNVKYDEYLKYKGSDNPIGRDYILFIDSATCYHPADYKNDPNFDEEHHLKQLNDYFDLIENKVNKPVVISLHPCSVGHLTEDSFNGRKTVYSQTSMYIQHASFVISFFSTSLINVILAKKPSLIITSEEIVTSMRRTQEECAYVLARMCGFTIDSLDEPSLKLPLVNDAKYNDFIETYLVNFEKKDKSNGEMIIDLLKLIENRK